MTYQPLREANPVPHEESLPTGAWDSSVLLDVIDERNDWMDTKQLTRPPERTTSNRGWAIALMAAAAVIVIGAVTAVMAGSGGEELAPSTEEPPVTVTTPESAPPPEASAPTTAAPIAEAKADTSAALSAPDQALVVQLVDTFNARDEAGIMALFAQNASVYNNLSWDTDIDGFAAEFPWRWAMGEQWDIVSCQQLSTISCTFTTSNDATTYRFGPVTTATRIEVADGRIVNLTLNESMTVIEPTLVPFYEWVDANHPGKLDQMRVEASSPGSPKLDEQSIALWLELLPMYKAEAGF